MSLTCRFCGSTGFPSRTKLFAHIRGTKECSAAAVAEDEAASDDLEKGAKWGCAAVILGYRGECQAAEELLKRAYAVAGARNIETTRASGHAIRGSLWEQEPSCGALNDVITVSFTSALRREDLWQNAQDEVRKLSLAGPGGDVCVFSAVDLHRTDVFNAEVGCTQRTYVYMLPWVALFPEAASANFVPRREDYRALKKIFRTVLRPEGHMGPTPGVASAAICPVPRSWHNFGDTKLPNKTDSQHIRIVEGMLHKFDLVDRDVCDGFALLRISAGDFLTQQCRKLVSAVLCIHHGWLPADFLITATRPDVSLTIPMAPAHLLYLEDCRFYHWERRHGLLSCECAVQLPNRTVLGPVERSAEWRDSLQATISEIEHAGGALECGCCAAWLEHVKTVDMPHIRKQLGEISVADALASGNMQPQVEVATLIDDCPTIFRHTLFLLREAAASGEWPDRARAGYIDGKGGGTLSIGRVGSGQHEMRGNALFPRLTAAVFDLELAMAPSRPTSTMVVINRNAQFKPHVDSGEGKGQTKTLIVGLGDYTGGELAVEGVVYSVRYSPLEFEGSKQQHWTLPFNGERYSLVYFSPSN